MKIPKIGKRGWLGVVLFATGLLTFFRAANQAKTEMEQSSDSVDERVYQNVVANGAGYNSFTDALADKNRDSGCTVMGFGISLIGWGFWNYGRKSSQVGKPQNNQSDKTTM